MSDRKRDTYIAIMVAAAKGVGIKLSWEECADLALDDAVANRAANALDEAEFAAGEIHFLGDGWKHIDPYRKRDKPYQGAMRDFKGKLDD